jgi:tetrahydromethanopterin S-methyltransferase subunit F
MRISKKVGLIIGAVILVVILGILFSTYSRQPGERNDLNARLSAAQTLVPILTTQKTDLENQLAQVESSLNANKAKFPESVESIEYGEYLFEIADECNVNLNFLTFPKPTAITIGAVTYSVVSLALPVSGELDNIFDFIEALRTDERFTSAEVTAVKIEVAGSATINLNIYGYKG